MSLPTLFDLLPPEPERCKTCRAVRPGDYTSALWLEPVSGECLECNHTTLREIHNPATREAAIRRHMSARGSAA